ncbi:MAG: sulfatase-like hydrolase/transferase [Planctomycetaceae bacterium]|nr:sulfatase-like hydrolase/transferase [Planctomycetales bacterium]MCB9873717.1 sulfatase-like hydrolase/transferase [Planctomycetaceae bacterium]MCB9938148.1 sulfatase-like hydrolase/transferase [Planctomycetaceae bacterium]
MYRRRVCLFLVALAITLSFVGTRSGLGEEKSERPNILFIYTDDHSHRTVSCYPEAYEWVQTPNIDNLAKRGVRFTHAYIGTWCMPSRATLLTGHHSYGVESMRMEGEYPGSEYDPARCPFWPSVFRKNGYCTAQIGKWHTGTDTGFGRDWDYQVVWNRPRHVKNSGAYYYDQMIETNGGEAKLVEGYSTDNYTNWASDFIRGEHRDAEKPWYLWVCYGAVHGPFTPADRHITAYPDITVPTPADIYPPRPGKPEWAQKIEYWVKGDNGEPVMKGGAFGGKTVAGAKGVHGNTLTDWVRQYHQGVLAIDEGVGKLMATLKETGQLDNTLVVFTSDQGFGWGQHGFCTKLAPYDATIRSPMIVSMPSKLPVNAVCESPVGGVDIVPTFFNFAGLELPWKMHGHDLTPLLKDPTRVREEPVLTTLTGRSYGSDTDTVPTDPEVLELNGVPWWVSLVSGRLKYIRALKEGQIEELYDLANDPEELTNLALDRDYVDKLAELRAATIAELRRTDAIMVDSLPPVKMAF